MDGDTPLLPDVTIVDGGRGELDRVPRAVVFFTNIFRTLSPPEAERPPAGVFSRDTLVSALVVGGTIGAFEGLAADIAAPIANRAVCCEPVDDDLSSLRANVPSDDMATRANGYGRLSFPTS